MKQKFGKLAAAASALAICAAMVPAIASAQTLAAIGTDNRAKAIGEMTDARVMEVLRSEGKVSMSGAFFETDSATLSSSAPQILFKLSNGLATFPNMRLAIIGHTDSVGDFSYNVNLSQRRAETVRNTLLGEPYNVAEDRLVAMGAGSIAPNASNLSIEGRGLNRRVEFVLLDEELIGREAAHSSPAAAPPHPEGVANAKALLKKMSDYMAGEESISFAYDATLEVVTADSQKLALASSGTVELNRPDKLHTTRQGGFADFETFFDGETLTFLGKNKNLYVQTDAKGTIDELVAVLTEKFDRAPPAADFLTTDTFDKLTEGVIDVKDLGSGVINGQECDFLAFRSEDIDWQIWIAHGEQPYPCRYTITSRTMAGAPQYTIQIRDWKTGDLAAGGKFTFANSTNAEKIDVGDLSTKLSSMPGNFTVGE